MGTGQVRLRLLGSFRVEGPLDRALPNGKAERLLKLLAAHHGRFVPVDSVIDVLWPDRAPDRADRNVAALVSRLRRALGRHRIAGDPSGYRLVRDDSTVVDLFEAEDLVGHAERELTRGMPALAAVSADQAVRALADSPPLLDERNAPWADELRMLAERQLRRARGCRWTAALELGEHHGAVEVASAALADDPLDEEACRAVILGAQRAGESGTALNAYEALRVTLTEQLGTDPSPATQAAFLSVLRAETPATSPRSGGDGQPAEPPRLVGRERELGRLVSLWTRAARGQAGVALVLGVAGIGKTALVDALGDQVRSTGGLLLTTSCFEAERSLYLQPLVDAVRTVVARCEPDTVRELAGEWLPTLSELVPELARVAEPAVCYERAAPELEHRRFLDALDGLFARLAEYQPIQLTVEDMHHAGQSTVEALHVLAHRWQHERVLLVATERSTDDPSTVSALRPGAVCIELGPLSPAAVATLAERAEANHDPEQLYAATGGSPLFVTELLGNPAANGSAIPGSLHETVGERLEHVGPEVSLLLAHAAILGSGCTPDEVATLSGLQVEDCVHRAERALRAGLLIARGESFRFSNDVVRRVAYDSMPEPVRISRHRRAARLFETRPEAAAHQLAAAGDWAEAAHAWLLAAHAAHLAFANLEAERLLTEALSAAVSSGDAALPAAVRLRRGQMRSELGRHNDARDDHEHALVVARELGDEELEARILEQLGWTALYARDAPGAVDLADRARYLAESAAAATGALPSSVLLLGRVRHWDGDYTGASAAYEQVLDADPGETTAATALSYQGALLAHLDRFGQAQSVLRRAAQLCRRTGQFRPLLQTLFFTGLARGNVGDFEGALRALDRARQLIDTAGVSYYRAGIDTTTSWLWQELGDLGRAREYAERGRELAHRGGGALELEQELHAQLALADCDLLAGRDDDAGARVEAAIPMLDRSLPFKPRAAMRLLEMRTRWDGNLAETLLDQARSYSSAKYEALALAHLGYPEQAARAAADTGSDLLIAQLGSSCARVAAVDRIARGLPTMLRDGFAARGRLQQTSSPARR